MAAEGKRVLAFHYAWYGTPWGPAGQWVGWKGERHDPDIARSGLRECTAAHYPLDGLYDSLSDETIRRQIAEAKEAALDGFIVSWWGTKHYSHRVLLRMCELAPEDFLTIYYETAMTHKLRDSNRPAAIKRIAEDLALLLEGPAKGASWMKVNGKPVIFVYIVGSYTVNEWAAVREELTKRGLDAFLVGDTLDPAYLDVFDGLHTYSPAGILASGRSLRDVYVKAAEACRGRGKLFAATVMPGYDDRKIRKPGLYVPRGDGSTYDHTWRAALACDPDWILVCTWNEWYEGTEIEPSVEFGKDYILQTAQYARAWKGS